MTAHFKRTLDVSEVRTYVQPFASAWTVNSGDAEAYDSDGQDVTSTLIDTVSHTANTVLFKTKSGAPAGIYTIKVTGNMTNGDIVEVPGTLTITD